jgi:hypothetical protein
MLWCGDFELYYATPKNVAFIGPHLSWLISNKKLCHLNYAEIDYFYVLKQVFNLKWTLNEISVHSLSLS